MVKLGQKKAAQSLRDRVAQCFPKMCASRTPAGSISAPSRQGKMNRISGTVSLADRASAFSSARSMRLDRMSVGEDGEGLAQAGAHLLGLAQHGGERARVVDAQAVGEGGPGVLARAAGAKLQHQHAQVDRSGCG